MAARGVLVGLRVWRDLRPLAVRRAGLDPLHLHARQSKGSGPVIDADISKRSVLDAHWSERDRSGGPHPCPGPHRKNADEESEAYSFLEDYQRDEIALLKTQIRQSKDEAEREKLEKALQSLQSRKESREAKDRAQSVLKAMKRDEREKVKLGKRPFYLKKSIYPWVGVWLICRRGEEIGFGG